MAFLRRLIGKGEADPPIRITFVDAATNREIGVSLMPVGQVPQSFAPDTRLNVMGTDWHVESAVPPDRADYVATGALRLVLRRIELIDPSKIMFSIPTISDDLPPIAGVGSGQAVALHEDDWRQLEFVGRRHLPEVEAELGDIRAVIAERVGLGFKRIHVRSRIDQPLDGAAIPVSELAALADGAARKALTLGGAEVVGGFVFATTAGLIYGREVEGNAVVVGIDGSVSDQLRDYGERRGLILVDWLGASSSDIAPR